ncbi:MAG: PAS domain-containing protein [Planctomycetota bacterium]|nr:MAG: PAS domain-containing protein [Planctomycetota bacterium]
MDLSQLILDSIAEGVISVDPAGRILALNRAAQDLTGMNPQQVVGQHCAAVFAPLCGGVCAIADTLASKRVVRDHPIALPSPSGTRHLRLSTNLLRQGRRVIGAVGVLRDVSAEATLRQELSGQWQQGDLIGRSPAMRKLFALLPAVAASPSTVLISGETGSGKELLARAIHQHSARASKPFVAVNCAALPENLLEAELFGVRKGAYTGADRDRPGRFARAEGGTILLDEVGDMPESLQLRLLRVLQEQEIEPLGSSQAETIDVRVIAASHRDLRHEVSVGRFRLDLYYRLAVVRLHLPPLRQRTGDLPVLAEHLLHRACARLGRSNPGLTTDALAALSQHSWPGNVRELEHVLEAALVLSTGGPLRREHLRLEASPFAGAADIVAENAANTLAPGTQPGQPRPRGRRRLNAAVVDQALQAQHGDVRAAAASLGVHRATLYRHLQRRDQRPS